jgi:hypothetical protein
MDESEFAQSSEEGPPSLQSDSRDSSAHPTQLGRMMDFTVPEGLDATSCQEFILAAAKAELEHQNQCRRIFRGQLSGSDEAEPDAPLNFAQQQLPHSSEPESVPQEDGALSLSGVIADLLDLKPAASHHDQDRRNEETRPNISSDIRDGILETKEEERPADIAPAHVGTDGVQSNFDGCHSRTSTGQMRRTNSGMSGRTSMESVMAACVGKVRLHLDRRPAVS